MNITQCKQIQSLLQLDHLRIKFVKHDTEFYANSSGDTSKKLSKHCQTLCLGLCVRNDFGAITIHFVDNDEALHTVLHELAHANGVRDCGECDLIADNLVDFVKGELC